MKDLVWIFVFQYIAFAICRQFSGKKENRSTMVLRTFFFCGGG